MSSVPQHINNIAQTLLHVGERVICVSKEAVIVDVWNTDESAWAGKKEQYKGKKLAEIAGDRTIDQCSFFISESIETGKDGRIETLSIKNNLPVSYNVRILHIAEDRNHVFVVFERIDNARIFSQLEDKWKLALDASGDGMWDLNGSTNEIYFSDKWHEIFGYSIDDIRNVDDWVSKIHPDDIIRSTEAMAQYQAGKAKNYSCEVRYRCKDGSYKWILSRGIIVSRTIDGRPLRVIGTHTDIHERMLEKQTHFSTLQLLSNLIDNLQDGILVIDGSPKILFANQAFCNMYDLATPPEELKGLRLEDSVAARQQQVKYPVDFAQRIAEIHNKRVLVLNDEVELLNGRIYSRDYIPITLANEEKGEIWRFRDITEQKLAQRRYENQRLFYERILNSIPADIAVHDPQHRFLFVNPSAIKDAELRKYLVGKYHEDYFNYRGLPLTLAKERNARFDAVIREKKPQEWEERIVNKEGRESFHLRMLSPLFDENGAVDLVIVYGVNITDRILAEHELQRSRDTFASAFNSSGIGMALLSREGKWLEVNKAICNMVGYTREELLELTFQDITYPDDLDADLELLRKLLNGEISNYAMEKRYISKSNKIVWAMLTVSFVKNSADNSGFFVSQIIDISAAKKLSDEINRKNVELEATKISLISKINQMDELTHIIAHNLRGPAGNINMLSDKNEIGEDEISNEEALQMIHKSSGALLDSLNTLMEMALIKLNNKMGYDKCDISEIVNSLISQLHGIIYEQRAVIKLNLEITTIDYPKVYLESILYNFISNALKYSAKDKQPEIIVTTSKVDNKIQLSVKDNGLGIDMAKYGNQVFKLNQVFHQGYDSKGVGLFITKTQIESLGGSIELKSKLNEGSEFIVTF